MCLIAHWTRLIETVLWAHSPLKVNVVMLTVSLSFLCNLVMNIPQIFSGVSIMWFQGLISKSLWTLYNPSNVDVHGNACNYFEIFIHSIIWPNSWSLR